MKVKIHYVNEKMSLESFADEHGLTAIIYERNEYSTEDMKFFAAFEYCEVQEKPGFLTGVHGDGKTPRAALRDYARKISNTKLIYNAYGRDRKEIMVPILKYE